MPRELEHRYIVDRDRLSRLLAEVDGRLEEVVYDRSRPIAWARTTYLDTPDERYLGWSREGVRLRVRLRQYASAPDLATPPRLSGGTWLEVKRSAGIERHKVRVQLSREETAAVLCGGLVPQVTTWYRRLSFAAGGIRLTVDQAIAYCRPALPAGEGEPAEPAEILAREPRSVLEIKSADRMPAWLAGALLGLPGATGFSKLRAAVGARDRERASDRAEAEPEPAVRIATPCSGVR